jgi:hypothetical protein
VERAKTKEAPDEPTSGVLAKNDPLNCIATFYEMRR